MTETTELKAGNWNDFRYFLPGKELNEREETHYLWQYGNNTELLDRANDIALRKALSDFSEDDVLFSSIGSGLRGVEIFSVLFRLKDEYGKETEAARKIKTIMKELQDYPVLDDEVFSNLEYETYMENLAFELSLLGVSKDDVARVAEAIKAINQYEGDSIYPNANEVKSVCLELGLIDEDEA